MGFVRKHSSPVPAPAYAEKLVLSVAIRYKGERQRRDDRHINGAHSRPIRRGPPGKESEGTGLRKLEMRFRLQPGITTSRSSGPITPILRWLLYADHRVAPIRRSCTDSTTAIIWWLDYADPGMASLRRFVTPEIVRRVRLHGSFRSRMLPGCSGHHLLPPSVPCAKKSTLHSSSLIRAATP